MIQFRNGTIGIKIKWNNINCPFFVVSTLQILIEVEQIPIAFILDYSRVVTVTSLSHSFHDHTTVLPGSKRRTAGCIVNSFGNMSSIKQVIGTVTFKYPRCLFIIGAKSSLVFNIESGYIS